MKLLVFGGRDYEWISVAWGALDALHRRRPVSLIMHGGARGADRLADRWAISRGVPLKRYPAPWYEVINVPGAVVKLNGAGKPYNAIAGHWRNQRMADAKPDLGLQFPGGTGTADMRHRLDGAGIPVIQVYEQPFGTHEEDWMVAMFVRMGEARGFKVVSYDDGTSDAGRGATMRRLPSGPVDDGGQGTT